MPRPLPLLTLLLTLGAATLSTGASALPMVRDTGIAAGPAATEVRYHRKYRRGYRAPQRVMGLQPGPDRRRARPFRLPR
ncbi:hypothetical protein ASG52_21645 [Methylobacterium sp. Leaf456]|uniref:hypothetical protein n=1 Tax=Methylobacterium sp. Leaf456 TaxID=1736382 RepID=UPI0006F5FBBB|nr:hypothetical protein [Methylobacterium sp. Leaf456]KQT58465.1 hypothetical protein ASG52_21645 [Methylobacterium sp. Leaf456]